MDDDQQFCLRWNNHQSTLISVFDTLLENGTLVDCTLAAEGKFLKAHKVVLSACSPYFAALLQEQYDKHPIFILKDVKFQELRAMMDYMYRGEVNISQDQLAALLKAAESLQIKGLSDNRTGAAPRPDHHRGMNVPASNVSGATAVSGSGKMSGGYTLEQTKRARIGAAAMDTQEMSGSREGSSSPTRRRRKVRRRSIENAMTEVHDNSNSSQQPNLQQSNANLAGVGAITAAASVLASQQQPISGAALPTGSGGVATATQGTTQQLTTNVTKKTESVKVTSDAMNTENVQQTLGGDEQDMEHIAAVKIDKQNHKQKLAASASSTAAGKDASDLVIEPKSEYDEDGNDETVEDLTLDDEDMGMDDLDQNAGTSQGGEGSSQGYATWQHDRSQDELLLATQEAQQRDPQGTPEGYWTILETVPYSLQNTSTATTITNASTAHQQHVGTSTDPNSLLTSATVVVEIPSDSVGGISGSTIQYTIPKAEHQLLRSANNNTVSGTQPATNVVIATKSLQQNQPQTIQIIKDQRVAPSRLSTTASSTQTQHQSNMQQYTIQECLETNVVHHHHTQTAMQHHHHAHQHPADHDLTSQDPQEEFMKINTTRLEEKMLIRNAVVKYEARSGNVTNTIVMNEAKLEEQQHHQQHPAHEEQHLLLEVAADENLKELQHTEEDVKMLHERHAKISSATGIGCGNSHSHSVGMGGAGATARDASQQLQYVCNVCGKSYKIKGSLKRHKNYECGVAPTLSCSMCPHKCKYKSDLRKHITQKHGGSEHYVIN